MSICSRCGCCDGAARVQHALLRLPHVPPRPARVAVGLGAAVRSPKLSLSACRCRGPLYLSTLGREYVVAYIVLLGPVISRGPGRIGPPGALFKTGPLLLVLRSGRRSFARFAVFRAVFPPPARPRPEARHGSSAARGSSRCRGVGHTPARATRTTTRRAPDPAQAHPHRLVPAFFASPCKRERPENVNTN